MSDVGLTASTVSCSAWEITPGFYYCKQYEDSKWGMYIEVEEVILLTDRTAVVHGKRHTFGKVGGWICKDWSGAFSPRTAVRLSEEIFEIHGRDANRKAGFGN